MRPTQSPIQRSLSGAFGFVLAVGLLIAVVSGVSALYGTWQKHLGQQFVSVVAETGLKQGFFVRPGSERMTQIAGLATSPAPQTGLAELRLSPRIDVPAPTNISNLQTGIQSDAAMESGMTGLATLFGEICEVNPETIQAGFDMAANLLTAKTLLTLTHILGSTFGLASISFAALFYLTAVKRGNLSIDAAHHCRAFGRWMWLGTVLALVSGLGLMINLHLTNTEQVFDPKLWVKAALLGTVMVTAALFEVFAIPRILANAGRPLFDRTSLLRRTLAVSLFAVLFISWWYLLFLGVSREYSFTLNGQTMLFGFGYAAGIAAGAALMLVIIARLFQTGSVHKRKYMSA